MLFQTGYLKQTLKDVMIQRLPRAVHYWDYVSRSPLHDMEWAFTLDRDFANLCTATQVTDITSCHCQYGVIYYGIAFVLLTWHEMKL